MKKLDIPFSRPRFSDEDRKAVLEVLKGHILTHGPNCRAFEEGFVDMMGDGFATSTSSFMAALHLSSLHIGLGPGDEVIVPAMTHAATVHAVELTGATPVFVDCELATGNLDIGAVEAAVTGDTKALFVVHFCGIPCDMPELLRIADKYGLKVVEDCALALGARVDGRHVGLFGDLGCFSFDPLKHITTGDGGMLVSGREDFAGEISSLNALDGDRTPAEVKIPGIYDVAGIGMNYRMSEMQAALGRTQLKKVPKILKRRATNFNALKEGVSKIEGISVLDAPSERIQTTHYCLIAVLGDGLGRSRGKVVETLNAKGIGTGIYYPHPVPRLSYYRTKFGYDSARYPNAEVISDHSIALPVGPHLDAKAITAITKALSKTVKDIMGA